MESTKAYFSHKKTAVSFLLSLLVFFIHFRAFSAFEGSGSLLKGLFALLSSLTHVAVPMFFALSGALFYRNYTLSRTLSKWKSRLFSLLVPYLVWNGFWTVLAFLGYYTPLGAFTGGTRAPFSLEALLRGIFLHGFFEPFWFLLQLLALTLLCPLIYLILKQKWVGLGAILAFWALFLLGMRLPAVPFANTEHVIFYLAGAWVGLHAFDRMTKRRGGKAALLGLCLFVVGCAASFFEPALSRFSLLWAKAPLTLLSVGGLWCFFDLFEWKRSPSFAKESFLIYATHSFLGAAITKILYLILPKTSGVLFLIAPVSFSLTVTLICLFGLLLTRFPRIKGLLTGQRNANTSKNDFEGAI